MQTKQCVHCKAQINIASKVCPFCRKNQNKSPLPWIILALVVFIVLVGILGSSNDDGPKVANDSNETSSSETNKDKNDKKQEKKKDFNQNEVVDYKGVKYQIISVKKSQGDTWDKPDSGKEFVIVTLKIQNNSNEKIDYNEYDWKMSDSNGNEEGTTFTTIDSNTSLISGSLDKDGVKQGTIVFEKTIGDKDLKLRYYDSYFDDSYSFQFKIS